MKRILIVFVVLLVGMLWSTGIAENDARQVAENMLSERLDVSIPEWNETYTFGSEEADFYVFNYNETGYIIVSADDRSIPVLAYSDEGKYIPGNMPVQFEDWLGEWQWQMQEIKAHNYPAGERAINEWQRLSIPTEQFTAERDLRDVSPLLSCNWNQDSPWNQYCPYGPGQSNPFVYSGCVAVSMAQIMYMWQHPTVGNGSHTYYHDQYGEISCDFSNTEFNYNSMNDSYATYETKELQWACGVAVEMNYSSSGSGAQVGYGNYSARNSMVNFFDYHPSATFRAKDSYSISTYEAYIREDLDNGRPLIFSGVDGQYGHAFNLDGYQGTSYFHFNWGWSGYANGYFYLSNLNPAGSAFNESQGAVFSLYPYDDYSAPYDVSAVILNDDDILISWDHNELHRSLIGFNIYVNGLLEETTDPDDTSFLMTNLDYGSYIFWITALFMTGESEMSEMITVDILAQEPPVADAGEDISAVSGELVQLDGSDSYDINGDELTYLWTAPAGIILDDALSVTPQFTAPQVTEETEYDFSLVVSDGNFFSEEDNVTVTVSSSNADNNVINTKVTYLENYPNPFNPETNIVFELSTASDVLIEIYNMKGQRITTLLDKPCQAGNHQVTWKSIEQVSGIYLLKFTAESYMETRKLVLLK